MDYTYHYRKWYKDTPEHIEWITRYYHRILQPYLPQDMAAPVLDIGCGMGFTLLALKQLGFVNLSGIDSDAGQVASCCARGLQVLQCSDTAAYLRAHSEQYQLLLAFDL